MKLRFPLFARILLWFFLNLLLLSVVFYTFFRVQFHVGLDTLLAGQAGARVEALARIVAEEFRVTPEDRWSDVLARFAAAYGAKIELVRPDGALIAGEAPTLPPEVRERLAGFELPRLPRRPDGTRPPLQGQRAVRPPPRADDAPDPRSLPPAESGPLRMHPKFMIRSTEPAGYWVGLRLPGRPDQPPQVLLIFSTTLSGGGLFVDFKPWVLVGFCAVVLSVLFWLPMIRSFTRAIGQLTAATGRIAEGRFDARVDARRSDELGQLGAAINSMAQRLDGFVAGQKRFLGDVAHELCSPLARMQVALGILEQRAEAAQRDSVNDVREEVQEMSNLVNELLSFSKASLRDKTAPLQVVRLAELARRVAAREAGPGGDVQVQIDEALTAQAEPDLLARALANLVRNAVRYAGEAGPVVVSAAAGADVVLSVSDAGPGVPADALQKIFDPFYRLESSRSRDTGGMGLGLAIVKTCVEACQGTVTARNREPSGLQVDIRLKA